LLSAKRAKVSVCVRWRSRAIADTAHARTHSSRDQRTSGPKRSQEAPGRKHQNTGDLSKVTSISYLPTTFTTLFFLAASLLLGYIQ
jgi:hypothetical protein